MSHHMWSMPPGHPTRTPQEEEEQQQDAGGSQGKCLSQFSNK